MGERKILKGVFKEGTMIASVVQEDGKASIMLKGAEPNMPRDPAFTECLQRAAKACFEHIANFPSRELCSVLVQRPSQAEFVDINPDDVKSMGVGTIKVMDGDCGLSVRVCDADPLPVPLAYASLRAGAIMVAQPGRVEIPSNLPRKTYKDLSPSQKQVFEAAVQLSGPALLKIVCVEDPVAALVVALKDLPPSRARSVILPLAELAEEVDKGAKIEDVVKKLQQPLRGG